MRELNWTPEELAFIQNQAMVTWHALSWKGRLQYLLKFPDGHVSGGQLRSEEELVTVIGVAERLSADLFVALNPTRPCGIKATKADVTHIRYLLIDMDPVAGSEHVSLRTIEAATTYYSKAYIVSTGRGLHVWSRFDKAYEVDEQGMSVWQWESMAKKYAERSAVGVVQVDSRCCNIDRVVRCPGSINQKTKTRAHFLAINGSGSVGWRLSDMFRWNPPDPEPEKPEPLPNTDLTDLTALLPHLKARHRDFLLRGVATERHAAFFATLKTLQELGVDVEHAEAWCRQGAMLSNLSDEMFIKRTVRSVFGDQRKT